MLLVGGEKMKKILLLILLIPFGVSASEYSNYEEYNESIDLTSVETVKKYKYFKVEYQYGPYELENTINEEYPLADYNDYIYSDYSDWTSDKLDKDHIEKTFYKYSTVSDTNKIIIGEFNSPNNYVNVNEIKVLYDGEEVNWLTECILCEEGFSEKLINGKAKINTNGSIILKLDREYETKKLNVIITFETSGEYATGLSFKYYNDDLENSYNYYYDVSSFGTIKVFGNKIKVNNTNKIIYSDKLIENEILLGEELLYKYRDKLYLRYRENKIYTDYLFENPDPSNYIKDEKEYIMFYKNIVKQMENNEEIPNNKVIKPEKLIVSENPIKLSGNIESDDLTLTTYPERINKTSNELEEKKETKNQDYSFAYVFLIIPTLLFIKIILLLSNLYKQKKNRAIV